MTGYTKLFNSIIGSTVWREDPATKVVWITLLALADQDGIVESSVPGLANYAGVSVPETETALKKFLSSDPYSRSPEHEGRRIEPTDGGWLILNHFKYREKLSLEDRRRRDRIRQQKHRERQSVTQGRDASVTECDGRDESRESLHADTDIDPDSKGKTKTNKASSALVGVPDWIPLESWNGFLEMRSRLRKPVTDRAKALLFSKLDRLRKVGYAPGTLLDQSTLNSWGDVYEPKTTAASPQAAPPIPTRRASTEMQRQLREG